MREITYADATREGLREEMLRDESVILFGEDIAVYGGLFGVTRGLQDEFGSDRVRDTPIAENGIAGLAMGAALAGMRPVAEIQFADFTLLTMDQIVNHAAKSRYMFGGQAGVPIVVRTQVAARRIGAQHSQSPEAWFGHAPGLKVVLPASAADAKALLKTAIRDDDPVIFIEHGQLYFKKGLVPDGDVAVPFGVANVARKGEDVTIVAISRMVGEALTAADELSKDGIEAEVVDPRTIAPLDLDTIIESATKTGRLIVTHEATTMYGVGAEIVAGVVGEAHGQLSAPPRRIGGLYAPMPYNKALEAAVLPSVSQIIDAARELCGERAVSHSA